MKLPGKTTREGPVVYLAGGLGNQIFMLAAGLSLSARHDTELFVDTSFFAAQKLRSPEILDLPTGAIPVRADSPLTSWRTLRGRVLPIPKNHGLLEKPPLLDLHSRRNAMPLFDGTPNRTLIGYFQSFEFFRGLEPQIARWLGHPAETGRSHLVQPKLPVEPFICVHIRRGDLMSRRSNSSALTPLDYFARAILELRDSAGKKPLVVFSDSVGLVASELQRDPKMRAHPVRYFDDTGLSSPEVLLAMSKADHFVLSASTFGFWAAWLAQFRTGHGISVMAPKTSQRFWDRVGAGLMPTFL